MTKPANVYENPILRKRAELIARRDKIAAELFQIVLEAEAWNRKHPEQKQLEINLDLDAEVTALCINSPASES